jgi:RHS repeat-associated protein
MNTVLVGDPVDVMTGVQFDVALDFRIAWPFPFEWRRFYSTARVAEHLALGWGHTHSYDHRLRFVVNGLLYVDPAGGEHEFIVPEKDGRSSMVGTGTLRRLAQRVYRVKVGGFPECEFHFAELEVPARLVSVRRGRSVHDLGYAADGRWVGLSYEAEPPVYVESDQQGRVHALVWRGVADGRDRVLWSGCFDEAGDLVDVTDPYRSTQHFDYDAAHRMIRITDRRGYGLEASYAPDGRCVRSTGADGVQEVRLRYDPAERVTEVTRADGGAWQYHYEPAGVASIVDPYGGVTRRVYGEDGRLEQEIGPAGEVLLDLVDDESGLLRPPLTPPEGMCLPLGDPWFLPVRDRELPEDALDWEGYGVARCRSVIRFPTSDSLWLRELPANVVRSLRLAMRPEEAEVVRGVAGRWALAGVSQAPKKAMGVPGYPGVLRHDAFGQLLSHTLPDGHSCRWQYDPNGNVTRHVDYAGSQWRYEYASWNLQVRATDPLGHSASYAFDLLERTTRVTDGGGTSTEHEYDLTDRLTGRRRHGGRRDAFGYDRSNGLVAAATGDGDVRVGFTLGPHRRPVEIAPAGQPLRRCTYDDRGRLVKVMVEEGEPLTFAYDDSGDRTADLRDGRGVKRRYEDSRLVECVVLGRFATRYTHNVEADRSTIVDPMGGRHVVEQLDTGVYLRRHANGSEELAQFDWRGQCLAKVRFRRGRNDKPWSRVFRYSPVGALLSSTDSARGTSTYEYDAAHRLVGAAKPDGTPHRFEHDRAGNLVAAPSLIDVTLTENRIAAANGRRFEYNERQHVSREVGADLEREYDYDAEDRLSSCRVGGRRVAFRYDALGRRTAKTISGQGTAQTTEFVWDGERLAAEISPAGALRIYVYVDGTAVTPFAFIDYDGVDAEPVSGQRRYVFSDQIACPVLVEDEAGEALWRAQIDPYGSASIQSTSRIELNLRWPGHYLDPETGLHYNRHRYYSPELGRYIQVDPRDLDGGVNIYAYSARPLDTVDVDGLAPCKKKPMVTPDENDKKFQTAKKKADKLAEDMREALKAEIKTRRKRGENTQALENTTVAAMVVVRKKNKYEVVIASNRNPARLPENVVEAGGKSRWIGHGDDRPPPVTGDDKSHRYERDKPRADGRDETTHGHAEQRGLRANDCDESTGGVAYIAPSRPCCEGCSDAIKTSHNAKDSANKGGWGGDESNVSDRGREPGPHGDWWD